MRDTQARDPVMQRLGVGSELPALLDDLGVPLGQVFDGTGVDPDTLRPDTRLPLRLVLELVNRAADVSGRPDFGFMLGWRFRLAHHGAIGSLMRYAPTLGAAMDDYIAWQPGYSSGAIVFRHPTSDGVALGFAFTASDLPARAQFCLVIAGIALRMVAELTGERAHPRRLLLTCRPEVAAAVTRHARVPVLSNQPITAVILPTGDLAIPLAGRDPQARADAARRISAAMEPLAPSAETQVRGALRSRLLFGSATMDAVAADVGVHPRTLRRRLSEAGTTFELLRDEVRLAVARELLETTDMAVGEIASALAYSTHGVFTESFRRMSGVAPTEWRARALRAA